MGIKRCLTRLVGVLGLLLAGERPATARSTNEILQYHRIQLDAQGNILPWNTTAAQPDLGKAYDQVIRLTWTFWRDMRRDPNGLPYYMNHQVWQPEVNDRRGIGGDQFAMALSSWKLLFAYDSDNHGFHFNNPVRDNMQFIADYYLANGLSPATAAWPNLPYPYNTALYSGKYDGDMMIGVGFTQPDKAGAFGAELLDLFQLVTFRKFDSTFYLDAAEKIADTLAAKVQVGDNNRSPLPFKVHAGTGVIGSIEDKDHKKIESLYTTNWAGTLDLFSGLIKQKRGKVQAYQKAFDTILAWMKAFPMRTQKWGPFFEDVDIWSDTQINAVTWAQWIMEHRELFPKWQQDVRTILDWAQNTLGNKDWEKYGVVVMNEQTAYRVPGNSHTARQAAAELRYAELTGDSSRKAMAIRQLSWATYMVDKDGKNKYFHDEVWMTDGYGDYVRHYLRAMAAVPELAPSDRDHVLRSSTLVTQIQYGETPIRYYLKANTSKQKDRQVLAYSTSEPASAEVIRVTAKPTRITVGAGAGTPLPERQDLESEGWTFSPLKGGGVLRIRHTRQNTVTVYR